MIKNIWCALCQKVLTDKETNLVSLIACVDSFTTPKIPVNISPLSLSTCWEKDSDTSEKFKVKISYKSPSGKIKEIFTTDDIVMENKIHRTNFVMDGFLINEEGKNEIIIEYCIGGKWKLADKVSLYATLEKKSR